MRKTDDHPMFSMKFVAIPYQKVRYGGSKSILWIVIIIEVDVKECPELLNTNKSRYDGGVQLKPGALHADPDYILIQNYIYCCLISFIVLMSIIYLMELLLKDLNQKKSN